MASYYKTNIHVTEIDLKTDRLENCTIWTGDTILTIAYNPGTLETNELKTIVLTGHKVAILGDLNAKSEVWGNPVSNINGR